MVVVRWRPRKPPTSRRDSLVAVEGTWKPRKGSFWMHLCISEFEWHESTLTSSDFRFSAIGFLKPHWVSRGHQEKHPVDIAQGKAYM